MSLSATAASLSLEQMRGFRDRAARLSSFERNVLLLLARGMSHEEIAFQLKRSEPEVFDAAWRGRARLEGTL